LSPNEIYAKISALFDASERHRRMSRVAVRAGALAIVGLAMIVTLGVKHSIDSSRRLEELRAGLKVLQSETATALLPYPADSIGTAVMKTKEAQELRDEASSELAVGSLWQSLAATREIARVTEDASIVGAALMSDERALLALDSRGTVHRWPLDRQYRPGTAFTATPGSTLSVGGSLALTRRGEVAAVGYGDGSIRLFNLTLAGLDGRPLLRNGTNPHPKDVSELVFSPDGTVLVSSSLDGTIVLWTREPTAPSGFQVNGAESWHPRLLGTAFAPAAVELTALDIRQEKDAIAFGRSDGQVCILKLDPGAAAKCNGEVHVRGESVKAVRFVPGRSALVSAGNDDSIAIWDLTPDLALSPTARRLFEDSDILDIDVSDDGQLIASASKDGSVRVYDAARLQLLAILLGHRDQVRVVRFGTASHVLVSGSLDRTARIWSPFEARSTVAGLGYRLSSRDANGSQLKVGTVAVGGSGKWVAFGADSSIYVKDADREEVSILTNESGADRSAGGEIAELSRLATHPTLPIVLASSRRPQIAVWRRAVKLGWMRRIVPLPGDVLPDARPRPMAISPDGRMLAVAISQDRQFIILVCPMARGGGWACTPSVGTLAKRFLIKPHDEGRGAGWPTSLAFSGSGRFLAVGDSNGAVRAFDLNAPLSDEELYTGHKRAVNAVSFSPDESSLVSASGDKTVMIWNRASRALRTTLKEHNDDVSGVAYSATGKFIVSVSKDKKVILWNAENGKMLARLPAGRNGILSLDVKITPMGSLMAIGSSGGKLDVMRFFESAEEIVGYSETYLKDNIRFAPEGS
jgi:WD40 repeat protein